MSETYLGEAPSYVKDWCKRNTYLTIEALDDAITVHINKRNSLNTGVFQIQFNDNDWIVVSWESLNKNTLTNLVQIASVSSVNALSKGDRLRFKNINDWSNNYAGYDSFDGSVYLNIRSNYSNHYAIVYGKLANSLTLDFRMSKYTNKFSSMFGYNSANIIDASLLNLNDITIGDMCYFDMFNNCTALTAAPALPATSLASYCYSSMFANCTSLINAPALPATSLASYCYNGMFTNCSSLSAIHFPKAFKDDETILKKAGSDAPWFGATNATIYYDL